MCLFVLQLFFFINSIKKTFLKVKKMKNGGEYTGKGGDILKGGWNEGEGI